MNISRLLGAVCAGVFSITTHSSYAVAVLGYNFATSTLTDNGYSATAVDSLSGQRVWADGSTLYSGAHGFLGNPFSTGVTGTISDLTVMTSDYVEFVAGDFVYGYNFATSTLTDNGYSATAVDSLSGQRVWADGGTLYSGAHGFLGNPFSTGVTGTISDLTVMTSDYVEFVAGDFVYGYNFATSTLTDNGYSATAVDSLSGQRVWADGGTLYSGAHGFLGNPFSTGVTGTISDLTVMTSDYVEFVVTEIASVPLPPAVWLFGSGLLGLIGIARRKKPA